MRVLRIGAVVAVLAAGVIVAERVMAKVDEPDYTVQRTVGDVEIRRYAPMVIATVAVSGTRRGAANEGFRVLADYIFGGNVPSEKIEMTAPVLQAPDAGAKGRTGAKIEMTAPVLQEPAAGGADNPAESRTWRVSFVMPKRFTLDTLPKPQSDRITFAARPAETYAVLRFSGMPNAGKLDEKAAALREAVRKAGIAVTGPPVFAFYDPPWTLPFLRRNEVFLKVTG